MIVAEALHRARKPLKRWDPLYRVWRLLTSVRFALYLLGLLSVSALIGTILPQIPIPMRGNPSAISAWVTFQEGKFGPFTQPLYRLGLFNVFQAPWFSVLLVVLLLAVAVCTANRFLPTWRSVARPQLRVADGYLLRTRHRARRDGTINPQALVQALRRQRYAVRWFEQEGATYLYADRYRWAQFATFVSHLSLILLLAGGLVTKLFGMNVQVYIAEGRSSPVFPVVNDRQVQIEVKDFSMPLDRQGRILDFRSSVVLYNRGVPVKAGDITVNGPLKWKGFIFHQVARQVNGAELQVRDAKTRQLLYNEVLDLSLPAPRPRLVVRDASGTSIFDEQLILPLFNEAGPSGSPATVVSAAVPGRDLAVRLRLVDKTWWMEIFSLGREERPIQVVLAPGETKAADGLNFSYPGVFYTAWQQVTGIPGVADGAVVMMPSTEAVGINNAVRTGIPADMNQPDVLLITGPLTWTPSVGDNSIVALEPGQPVVIGDYEYTFTGRRAFTGLVARQDPGSWIVWVALTLIIVGVCVTFYFPRRRLWAKVSAESVLLAGVADRGSKFGAELQQLLDGLPTTAAEPAEPVSV